jgi:SAM-dependent methyltransferase
MSRPTRLGADDAYGSRQPTSHERHAGQPWDASYRDGPPRWDIGAPQAAVVRLASAGVFAGSVLDAGCGTGENALHIGAHRLHVLGADVAATAVSIARESAAARGFDGDFIVADALRLDRLGRVFDTVLDCALLHALDNDERRGYVVSLASVTRPGGHLYVLCFSDTDPQTAGPHPVSQLELSEPFTLGSGWSIASIGPERLQARFARTSPVRHGPPGGTAGHLKADALPLDWPAGPSPGGCQSAVDRMAAVGAEGPAIAFGVLQSEVA